MAALLLDGPPSTCDTTLGVIVPTGPEEAVMLDERSWRRALPKAVTTLFLVTGLAGVTAGATGASAQALPDGPASSSTGTKLRSDWKNTSLAVAAASTTPTVKRQPFANVNVAQQAIKASIAAGASGGYVSFYTSGVHQQNASGSNGQVSIDVQSYDGSGPDITYWLTTAIRYGGQTACYPIGEFLYGPTSSNTPNVWDYWAGYDGCYTEPAGTEGEWYAVARGLPYTFSVGTWLCDIWGPAPPLSGRPCEEVG